MKITIKAVFITSLLMLFSSNTFAAKPADNDNVACADLKDATAGLYGLCVSYCEANAKAIDSPSAKAILASYNRRKQDSDAEMPNCIEQTCTTAWTMSELRATTNGTEVFNDITDGDETLAGTYTLTDKSTTKGNNPTRVGERSVQIKKTVVLGSVNLTPSQVRRCRSNPRLSYCTATESSEEYKALYEYSLDYTKPGRSDVNDKKEQDLTEEQYEICKVQIIKNGG